MGQRVKAAVAGANGYAGMTLVHLLARHPGVELVQLTSRSFAGKPYSEVFPLDGLEGEFLEQPDAGAVDVVFRCLPHNVGAVNAAGWPAPTWWSTPSRASAARAGRRGWASISARSTSRWAPTPSGATVTTRSWSRSWARSHRTASRRGSPSCPTWCR